MKLFTPVTINSMQMRNRVVMAPVSTNLPSASGEITPEMTAFYLERAKGGTGLIILEACCLDYPVGKSGYTQIRMDSDSYLPGMYQFVETIHETGCKIAFQIAHCGGMLGDREHSEIQPIAPSPMSFGKNKRLARAATVEEIHTFQKKFIAAGERVKHCGADAVEVHGGSGYLIAEFLSPWLNLRTDEYGGSVENRSRFAVEIVAGLRKVVGPDFPIIFRINGDELTPSGRRLDETVEVARLLKEAGVDCFHVTAGSCRNPWIPARRGHVEPMSYQQGWKSYMAKEIREKCDVMTIAVGSIRDPEVAERIVNEDADCVAMGRQLIADPQWVYKAQNRGHIRKCVSCNSCVMFRSYYGGKVRCAINPLCGKEYRLAPPEKCLAEQPKKVAVIGGGPGGMEAAYIAKIRGHQVTLFEAADHLGGNLHPACRIDLKYKLNWLTEWLSEELAAKRVDVRLGVKATACMLKDGDYDTIILATGSKPFVSPLLADDLKKPEVKNVFQAIDFLSGRCDLPAGAKEAVVLGAGLVGLEAGYQLARDGLQVKILEGYRTKRTLLRDAEQINGCELLYRLGQNKALIWDHTQPLAIREHTILINRNGEETELPYDVLILAQGQTADNTLAAELKDCGKEVIEIGDCVGARIVFFAVQEGFLAAYQL